MRAQLLAGLRALIVLTVLCGLAYPLVVTGVAQVAFDDEADGSLVRARRRGRRLVADRPGVRRRRVLPHPAVGRRRGRVRLVRRRPRRGRRSDRRDRTGRSGGSRRWSASGASNLGPTNEDLPRHGRRASRRLPGGQRPRCRRAGAGRRRHRLGIGARPAHLGRQRPAAGGSRVAAARGLDCRGGARPDRRSHRPADRSASSARRASTCSSSTSPSMRCRQRARRYRHRGSTAARAVS